MPRQYERIKQSELAAGKSPAQAKQIAAATWNKGHPGNPITPHREPKGNYAMSPATIGSSNFGAFSFGTGTPKTVIDLYHDAYEHCREEGKDHAKAHQYAIAMVRHAGWYRVSGGKWKQLTPDLRDKVNVREAVKQPDGRYVVEGVDVFYPNAAKGPNLPFDADDIQEMIGNTNRGIESGGQKPGLIEGHPNELQAALGTQLPVLGSPVNFRKSPRGKGWARCDVVDIDPSVVARLQKRQLTGLSAGIAKDAGGLNRRFGHVALLGGASQALSHLPVTEIYSVSNQLCFSADAGSFSLKGKGITMSKNMKELYDSMGTAYAAYEAALASHESGEPESVEKLRSAGDKWKAAVEAVKGMQDPEHADNPTFEGMPAAGEEGPVAAGGGDAPLATVPGAPDAHAQGFAAVDGINFEADPAGAFNALVSIVKNERGEKNKLTNQLRALTKLSEGLMGRVLRTDFSAEIEKLEREGYQLPGKAEIEEQFSAAVEAPNPRKSLDRILKLFRSMPKKQSPAGTGQVFGAVEQRQTVDFSADSEIDASLKRVTAVLGSASFSEQEMAIGRAANSNGQHR